MHLTTFHGQKSPLQLPPLQKCIRNAEIKTSCCRYMYTSIQMHCFRESSNRSLQNKLQFCRLITTQPVPCMHAARRDTIYRACMSIDQFMWWMSKLQRIVRCIPTRLLANSLLFFLESARLSTIQHNNLISDTYTMLNGQNAKPCTVLCATHGFDQLVDSSHPTCKSKAMATCK